MKALTVVWNKPGDECVGFTDAADARYASGKKLSGLQHICGVSTLAEAFRETYDEGVKLENVVVVGAEGLEGLRKLRLYHWNGVVNLTAHMDRLKSRPEPIDSRQAKRREDSLFHLNRAYSAHVHFVQFLNDFFDIGDTAEKDAAK